MTYTLNETERALVVAAIFDKGVADGGRADKIELYQALLGGKALPLAAAQFRAQEQMAVKLAVMFEGADTITLTGCLTPAPDPPEYAGPEHWTEPAREKATIGGAK